MPALTSDIDWDYFSLDGFGWNHLLDFLGVPHYSNKHRDDQQAPLLFDIRTIALKDPDIDEDDEGWNEQFLVVWRPGTDRPTAKQIQDALADG